MTNEECLKKAIERAEKNVGKKLGHFPLKAELIGNYYYRIIFSHDFAKGFWGIEWKDGDIISTPMSEILEQENIAPWQHHLRQFVLEPKPLKYLEKHL